MGRINGFLGGTLFTASITYLTLRRLHMDTSHHSLTLRSSRNIAESILSPTRLPKPPEPRLERPSFVETLKDSWNDEVEGMVRCVQAWDGRAAREKGEKAVGVLIEKLRGVNS